MVTVFYATERNQIRFLKKTISANAIHLHKGGKGSPLTNLTFDLEVKVNVDQFCHQKNGPKSSNAFLSMKEWS